MRIFCEGGMFTIFNLRRSNHIAIQRSLCGVTNSFWEGCWGDVGPWLGVVALSRAMLVLG